MYTVRLEVHHYKKSNPKKCVIEKMTKMFKKNPSSDDIIKSLPKTVTAYTVLSVTCGHRGIPHFSHER